MRPLQAVVCALLTGVLAGCFTEHPDRPTTLFDVRHRFAAPPGEEMVHIDMVQLDRPLGDAYVNRELWAAADEEAVGAENKKRLNDNGLYVCEIGGQLPSGLQQLLASKRNEDRCRRVIKQAGKPVELPLGPPLSDCRFKLLQDGEAVEKELPQAECLIEVVPTPVEGGRLRLHFIPRIKYGQPELKPRPLRDASGKLAWDLCAQQPEEEYPWLGWELTVSPSEYVILGTRTEREGTFGYRCFVGVDGSKVVQRLLVVRAYRASPDFVPFDPASAKSPPLALQAELHAPRSSP
jgi:hypothetical protein